MARGYRANEVREMLMDVLNGSKTGLSGTEISERLGINRVTMAKYLNVFATEGLIRQKNIGNITLWSVEEGTERFQFPNDYFQAQKKYQDLLLAYHENQAYALIRSCLHSGASAPKIMTEIIVPSIKSVRKIFDDGKIGNSEQNLLNHVISNSIRLASPMPIDADPKKNAILLAADPASVLLCESASASLRAEGWNVSVLGDMSASINVLFDLDLQRLLGKVWRGKPGTMVVSVFSQTEGGLNFFAESVRAAKRKAGRNMRLVLCGRPGSKTPTGADLVTEDLGTILQWSQTAYEGSVK